MGGPGPCGGNQPVETYCFPVLPGVELVECDGDPTQFTPVTAAHTTGDGYRLIGTYGQYGPIAREDDPGIQALLKRASLNGLRGSYPTLTAQLQRLPLAILRNPSGDPSIKINLMHRGVADWWPEAHEAIRQLMRSDPDVRVRAYATARLRNLESISVAEAEETFCACLQQAKATQLAAVLQVIPSLDAYSDALWLEVFRVLTGDGVTLEDFQTAELLVMSRSWKGWRDHADRKNRLLSALMVAARYDRRADIKMAAFDTIKLIDVEPFVDLLLERMQVETDPRVLGSLFDSICSWMYVVKWNRYSDPMAQIPMMHTPRINRLIDGLLRLQMIGKWDATNEYTPLKILAFIAEKEPDLAGPARAKAVDLARAHRSPWSQTIISHWGQFLDRLTAP